MRLESLVCIFFSFLTIWMLIILKGCIFVYQTLDGSIWLSGIYVIYDEPCVMTKSLLLGHVRVFYGPNLHRNSESHFIWCG